MEEFLDALWLKILVFVDHIKTLFDFAFAPLNSLGPAIAIFTIALVTVIITKILTRIFVTKRYKTLKEDFEYWYKVRQEAMKGEEREKSKHLAKNIDQAKLNKAYYDYFFEGFLIRLMTRLLPIFTFLAYVNEAYKPGNLRALFGRDYVFKFSFFDGQEVVVGAVFWFVLSLAIIYLTWSITKRMCARHRAGPKSNLDEDSARV
jgi:uncharacterized membrane protein (DUF106 family)